MRVLLVVLALVVAVAAQGQRLTGTPRIKFAISADRKVYFNLIAGNGEKLMTSETYNSWDSAFNGAAAVVGTGGEKRFYEARSTHYVLKGANSEVIGKSENLNNVKRGVEQCVNEVVRLTQLIAENVVANPAPGNTYRIQPVEGNSGKPHYRLVGPNNKIVGFSENFEGKGGMITGIAATIKECRTHENFRQTGTTPHFDCVAANHKVLFQSQPYKRNANRDKGLRAAQNCVHEEILRYFLKDDPIAEAKEAYSQRIKQHQQTAEEFTGVFDEKAQQQS